MKKLIKGIISRFVQNDYCWAILNATLVKISKYAEHIRRSDNERHKIISEAIQAVCPDYLVKHGPFKGMRYPETNKGGTLFPKLLGC